MTFLLRLSRLHIVHCYDKMLCVMFLSYIGYTNRSQHALRDSLVCVRLITIWNRKQNSARKYVFYQKAKIPKVMT